ncbi:hypothetical protein DNTS_016531, partial [Danionella cerebrum]
VMYFSSVFPYVVLLCFLIRGLEIWADVQVWRQAATQVFFALGLGFGSVIAYSSFNPQNNNCHRDAFTVSGVNFMTSILATLVVFAVLGFRAKLLATQCVKRSSLPNLEDNNVDVEKTTLESYDKLYTAVNKLVNVSDFNITTCSLEKELEQ